LLHVFFEKLSEGELSREKHGGKHEYIDRWPAFIDLEEKLYRPLIQVALPAIFGAVCAVLDRIFDLISKLAIAVGSLIAGILDICTDSLVVLLRNTVYRDSPIKGEPDEGTALTHAIGVLLNKLEALLNKTLWRSHPNKKDLEHWFVLKYASFKESSTVIGRSLPFGLVLFCVGLCVTLIYMLVSAFI